MVPERSDMGGDFWERLVCYGFKGVLLDANVFTGLARAFAEGRDPRENVLYNFLMAARAGFAGELRVITHEYLEEEYDARVKELLPSGDGCDYWKRPPCGVDRLPQGLCHVFGDYERLDRSDLVEDIRENREVSRGLYRLCRRVGYNGIPPDFEEFVRDVEEGNIPDHNEYVDVLNALVSVSETALLMTSDPKLAEVFGRLFTDYGMVHHVLYVPDEPGGCLGYPWREEMTFELVPGLRAEREVYRYRCRIIEEVIVMGRAGRSHRSR